MRPALPMPSDAPENLRKFLESDDLAMITMGLSMAKGSADASRQTLGLILGLYMFHGDKEIRSLAKTAPMRKLLRITGLSLLPLLTVQL